MQTSNQIVHTVYKTTNLVNGKFYIGYHKTANPNDDYLGSGTLLWRSIHKHGIQNFKKEVLAIFETAEEAFNEEVRVIALHRKVNPLCLNLQVGGSGYRIGYAKGGFFGPHTEEARKKISAAGMGRKCPAWLKEFLRTREISTFQRQRISQANSGRTHTEETKKKISRARIGKGHPSTLETNQKISLANSGHSVSADTRAKISLALRKHERPQVNCRVCKKLFQLSYDQTRSLRFGQTEFACSKICTGKSISMTKQEKK